jgi:HK97 family phage major capsid protein
MSGWKKDELAEFITETMTPVIKDTVGKEVAEVVEQRVKDLAPEGAEQLFEQKEPEQKERPEREKGADFALCARALARGKNDPEKAIAVLHEWGQKDVAGMWEKAMGSNVPEAGGFLVPTEFSSDVIELLRASGSVRGLNPSSVPMMSGTIKVPKITSGTSASYIGENTNIGKTELETGQLTLTFKKLAALVPVSNDLIRYAAPSADTIVRDDLVRSIVAREDLAFIRDDGLSGKPKGIKEWIHADNKFTANTTVNLANVTSDLGKCMELLMDANINLVVGQASSPAIDARPGWLFNPQQWRYLTTVQTGLGTHAFREEMLRGTLWGFPFRVSTQVEDDTVYFGAFAHAVIGEAMGLSVDVSDTAAYSDGSNVVAAFSQDQTVIRVIVEHDFALRHDKAFALIDTVTWGD